MDGSFPASFSATTIPWALAACASCTPKIRSRLHRHPGCWIQSSHSPAHGRAPYLVLHFPQTDHPYSGQTSYCTQNVICRYFLFLLLLYIVTGTGTGLSFYCYALYCRRSMDINASLFQDLFLPVRITYGILRSHYPAFLSIRSRLALPSVLHPQSMGNTL